MFTPTENVLTTCEKTTADQELGRTREGGGRQRRSQGFDASNSAQQTAEEEKDETVLGQAMAREATPSWAV